MCIASPGTVTDIAALLARAMADAGHDQPECAEVLRTTYGLASASQPNVSRWLRGTRPNKEARAALMRYCEDFASRSPEVESVGRDETAAFEELQRQVAGEALLGPRQAALVDTMIERLRAPHDRLSVEEVRLLEWLTKILGFDPTL